MLLLNIDPLTQVLQNLQQGASALLDATDIKANLALSRVSRSIHAVLNGYVSSTYIFYLKAHQKLKIYKRAVRVYAMGNDTYAGDFPANIKCLTYCCYFNQMVGKYVYTPKQVLTTYVQT